MSSLGTPFLLFGADRNTKRRANDGRKAVERTDGYQVDKWIDVERTNGLTSDGYSLKASKEVESEKRLLGRRESRRKKEVMIEIFWRRFDARNAQARNPRRKKIFVSTTSLPSTLLFRKRTCVCSSLLPATDNISTKSLCFNHFFCLHFNF